MQPIKNTVDTYQNTSLLISLAGAACSLACFCFTLAVLGSHLSLSTHMLLSHTEVTIVGFIAASLYGLTVIAKRAWILPNIPIAALLLILLFCSPLYARGYSLVNLSQYVGEFCFLFMLSYYFRYRREQEYLSILLCSVVFLLLCLCQGTKGGILFSDDHATFLYRLQMLKEHFPFIPFYNPLWNTGIDERYFFATGTLNIFFLTAPLIYLTDLWKTYTLIPAFILFILVPAATYIAAQQLRCSARARTLASVLALSSSLGWYHWGLSYGTLGFLTTAALTPLLAALCARVFKENSIPHFRFALSLIATTTLVLFWSPGGIIFLPAIFFGLAKAKTLLRQPIVVFVLAGLFVINTPWILVFWSASNVSSFLQKDEDIKKVPVHFNPERAASTNKSTPADSLKKHLDTATVLIRKNFQGANPIILFCALVALLAFRKEYRLFYASMAIWLITLGAFIAPFKPQMEFDRMLIVFCLFMAIPVAETLDRLLCQKENRSSHALCALFFSLLTLTLLASGSKILKRGEINYGIATPFVDELANQLTRYEDQGRVLFSGFVLHDLDGGHLAPLTTKTKTPLIASSQVHKHWKYKDVIPEEFLGKGSGALEEYFNLVNVAAIVSSDRTWRSYFFDHPELYRLDWQKGRFFMFSRVAHDNNYFLTGEGTVLEQQSDSVVVSLREKNAILKFNYFPFLQAPGCTISKETVSPSVHFIALKECPTDTPIRIFSKPAYARVFS